MASSLLAPIVGVPLRDLVNVAWQPLARLIATTLGPYCAQSGIVVTCFA